MGKDVGTWKEYKKREGTSANYGEWATLAFGKTLGMGLAERANARRDMTKQERFKEQARHNRIMKEKKKKK